MKKILVAIGWFSLLTTCTGKGGAGTVGVADPLPSWTGGATKQAILTYIKKVTDTLGPGFIPTVDRIATFDNDGTLWAERPYVQQLFAIDQARKMIAADPHLTQMQPFKAIANNDDNYFKTSGDKALLSLVVITLTGMTEDAFEKSVANFFARAVVHGRPLRQIVYQPQLELLAYLRANGFKLFICTGGTVELVRGISMSLYGIPKDQVIGTSFRYRYNDSTHAIEREPALDHLNDKEGKPVGIQLHIGSRPVFACGNVGGAGDIQMLQFSQGSRYPSFQLLINHDDSIREFFYQEKDNASLHAAVEGNWQVVSMKANWKTIFSSN